MKHIMLLFSQLPGNLYIGVEAITWQLNYCPNRSFYRKAFKCKCTYKTTMSFQREYSNVSTSMLEFQIPYSRYPKYPQLDN